MHFPLAPAADHAFYGARRARPKRAPHSGVAMSANSRLLVLLRHGQSDWNLKNLFTGWKDPDLSPKGVEEAKAAGQRLKAKGLKFDICFTSALTRAQHTLKLILNELGQTG